MYGIQITIQELFGLSPLDVRLKEALLGLRGDGATPKTRFDLTSLRILQPRMSFPLWLGDRVSGRRVPIYNFFCRTQPPPEEGWSLRVTQARDYRGLQATYDSHNGTDFAVPPGTMVVAAAAGRVLRVSNEFHRGGLKVFIDHGRGLFTSSNHLARSYVEPGEVVRRGQPIALSGYSGMDGVLAFPFSTPHVHFNVWRGGEYVDPFARDDEVSLWRTRNDPRPWDGAGDPWSYEPTPWDAAAIDEALSACIHDGARADILSGRDLAERGMNAHFQLSYFPTRFSSRPRLVSASWPPEPSLDLPFSIADFDGVAFPSDERSRVRG